MDDQKLAMVKDALQKVDRYWTALMKQWTVANGKLLDNGGGVIPGTEELDEFASAAAESVLRLKRAYPDLFEG